MSVYDYVDALAEDVERVIWAALPTIAEQAGVTVPDALAAARRVLVDRLKALKPAHGVDYRDDGRAALWRVRLQIWEGDSLLADTVPGPLTEQALQAPGTDLIYGLPSVARWVLDLVTSAHDGYSLDGVDEATLLAKLRTVRVALSNQGGACIWRVRYIAWPKAAPPSSSPGPGVNRLRGVRQEAAHARHFLAHVRLSREESTTARRSA